MDAPSFVYGTAWKEDRTRSLVEVALARGFRAIDTANQRRHYHEAGVGEALAAAFAGGFLREDLWLQTKFTYVRGQDHRLPYDPAAPVAAQVQQSFESSLAHLHVTYLDSYVLHGPAMRYGLHPSDWEAWRAMEELAGEGKARVIGVSNVTAEQLEELCDGARVAPAWVQNRCYAQLGWDADVRAVCRARGIRYQGFSLLTANGPVLASGPVRKLASALGRTPAQVVFRFARQVGMVPLTGTTDPAHMTEDLGIDGFELAEADVRALERIAT
ncbi:MAG: aldo/keto reductase [Acidobacteriota bacterium]